MATTRLEYTGNGSNVTFSLGNIDLINRSDLKVYIFEPTRDSNTAVLQSEATNAGTAGTNHPQYNASDTDGSEPGDIAATTPVNNYQFATNNSTITFNTDNGVAAPSANAIITLERITSEEQNDFSSQGTIRASELNSELRRIQHIAEEGVNEAKLSIKESKFSANAVDVGHPTLGTDRRIEHVANADSDDDAVNRIQLRKVIHDDLIEGEGIDLTDSTGGTNSAGQTVISGEDSSKTNKGIVTINEGEGIDVTYTNGDAVIKGEYSSKSNKGIVTINSGHGINVSDNDENDGDYNGNAIISSDRSTPTQQGIIQLNQVAGEAINVTHAVGGTVGDVTVGVDRSTASQQGVVKIQSTTPILTTYTSDGEVNLSVPDNTVDLTKIKNDDVITYAELNASTTVANYPNTDWDSDDTIVTGKALAKRFDAIMYSNASNKGQAPTETNWTEGKIWYDHLNDQTLSMWEKTGANTGVWRAITSGGTFTSQPKVMYVDSVNGSDLNDGHRIIKAKKTIRGALLDVNENITSTTTTNVSTATYNHETGLLAVTTDANHNLRVGMKVTMAGLVWSCNYGGGTNNHTFPEADDPLRFVSNIVSNTEFECQLEPTVTAGLAHTYVSGGTVTNQAGRVGQGWMLSVAAGTYQEILPLRVEADNVSIVGTTMRSCFIHPSVSQRYDTSKDFNASDAVVSGTSEYNTMFEMNSGTYIWGFAFSGLKAGGWTTQGGSTASARGDAIGYVPEAGRNEQRTNVDPDSNYGLPPVQGWIAAFRPGCSLKKSPYIQNCTSISDTDINNAAYDPVTQTGGLGGDRDSGMTSGGILVDGSVPSTTSPLRSFVVDAFTQINMDGPGILCTNNGYAQLVSFFGTFCHYHAKSLNGGMLNLSNCTTDYGRYGLIADGKSSTTIFTSTVDGAKAAGQTSFNIDATTITSGYFGTGYNNSTTNLRPGDSFLVGIGSDLYEIESATPVGGSWTASNGWTINIMKTNATNPAINDGLTNAITDGATVNFYQRSYISTGGHTFEYSGAGTDYRAAPENGGVPIEANEVINRNMGKVWQSSTNHVGKFKVGDTFVIDQRSGKVESKGITLTGPVTTNGNDNLVLDPAGTGVVTIGNLTVADGSITDSSGAISFGNENLSTTGTLAAGNTTVGTLGASGDVTFNTGNITTASNANITLDPNGTGIVSLGANIDVNGNTITSNSNGNIVIDPHGTGSIEVGADIVTTSNADIKLKPHGTGKIILDGDVNTLGNSNLVLNPGGSGVITIGSSIDVNGNSIISTNNGNIPINPNGSGKVILDGLNWPTADGTANYYLQTNGSGQLQWAAAASTTAPTISNPTVTGNLVVTDNIRLTDDDDSNWLTLTAPSTISSNVTLTLPGTAPSANQYLKAGSSNPVALEWENALAITTVQTAANESAMLGLTTQEGDVVVRTDENKTYIKNSGTAGSMADFTHLQSPTAAVTSVNGSVGAVVIPTDKIDEGDTSVEAVDTGDGHVKITTEGTERLRVLADGKVGVGLNNPGLKFHVQDGALSSAPTPNSNCDVVIEGETNTGIQFLSAGQTQLRFGDAGSTAAGAIIYQHSGDNFKLNFSNSGYLSLNDGGGENIRFTPNNEIGIGGANYGTSGQVLTSGGSGAAISWASPPGSTIEATANGSLTAGDPVIIKSNGEVTKAAGAFNVKSPYTCEATEATGTELSTSDVEDIKVLFDPVLSASLSKLIYWIAYRNQNASDQVYLGSYNATDGTWDSSPSSAFGGSAVIYGATYDTDNDKMIWTYRDASGNYDVSTVTSSAFEAFTVNETEKMADAFSGNENPWIDVDYLGSSRAVWVGPSSSTAAIAKVITIASNGTMDVSSDQTISVDSTYHKLMRVAGNGTEFVVAYTKSNDGNHGWCRVGTISGTGSSASVSFGSETEFYAGSNDDIRLEYDSVNDKYLFFYGSNPGYCRVGTVSGSSISFGTQVQVSTGSINNKSELEYNVKTGSFTIAYQDSDENSKIHTRDAKISGTSVTLNTAFLTSQYTSGKQYGLAHGYVSDTLFGSFLSYRYNTGKLRGHRIDTMILGTNLTTENFIGFSKASYSTNATATINVTGSTDTNQSSLTPGQKYYVQQNGTLGLTADTPEVFAGTAIAATKLLVRDHDKPYSPSTPSEWEVFATHDLSTLHSSSTNPIINTGWSSAYQNYKIVMTGVSKGGTGLKIWMRWYFDSSPSSTATGTLATSDKYYEKRVNMGSTSIATREANYHKLSDDASPACWHNVTMLFPMMDYTGDAFKGCYGDIYGGSGARSEFTCFYDNNTQEDQHIKGVQIYFEGGTSGLGGRITFMRQNY